MKIPLSAITKPRYSSDLQQLHQTVSAQRHELYSCQTLDILFLPEQQIAYIAQGTNPVRRITAPCAVTAVQQYQAQQQQLTAA